VATDRHIYTGMEGDCRDGRCGRNGQLSTGAGERKCVSDWDWPLVEVGKGSRRKGHLGLSYTSRPRIADFGCDPDCVRRKPIIVLKGYSSHKNVNSVINCSPHVIPSPFLFIFRS